MQDEQLVLWNWRAEIEAGLTAGQLVRSHRRVRLSGESDDELAFFMPAPKSARPVARQRRRARVEGARRAACEATAPGP